MEVDADGFAVSYRLGILWELASETRFGLSYRSKVDTELEGEPDFSNLNDSTRDHLSEAGLLERDVQPGGKLPPATILGAYRRLPNGWDLTADLAYIARPKFQLLESSFVGNRPLQRGSNNDDVWAGTLGVSWPLSRRWRTGISAAYMDSPIDAGDRSFGFRIASTWIVGVGFERQLGGRCSLAFNLNYLDLGDGQIVSEDFDNIGVIESRYDSNRGLVLDLRFSW